MQGGKLDNAEAEESLRSLSRACEIFLANAELAAYYPLANDALDDVVKEDILFFEQKTDAETQLKEQYGSTRRQKANGQASAVSASNDIPEDDATNDDDNFVPDPHVASDAKEEREGDSGDVTDVAPRSGLNSGNEISRSVELGGDRINMSIQGVDNFRPVSI